MTRADKPVVVRLTKNVDGYGSKGAEFGYSSEAQARKVLGDDTFTIVSHQDGSPVEQPKKAAAKADEKKDASA
jgi:hypothetical protein